MGRASGRRAIEAIIKMHSRSGVAAMYKASSRRAQEMVGALGYRVLRALWAH